MRKQLLKSVLILLLTVFIFFVFAQLSPVQAAEYYIAGDTGLDTNPGTSSQPWKTLTKANTTLIAGDTVNVKGGLTYDKRVNPSNSGTNVARITYKAWVGTGIPQLKNVTDGYPVRVVARNYITINGFQIDSSAIGKGIDVANATEVIISNCIFTSDGFTYASIFIFAGSVKVYNNTFTCRSCGNGVFAMSGIMAMNVSSLDIKNNLFYGLPQKDPNYIDSAAISFLGTTSGTHSNNIFFNNDINYYGTVAGANETITNPLFVDPITDNFSLQTNSPAINSGADVFANGVTTDTLGRGRPNAGNFDIGAYEDPNLYVAGDVATSGNGSMQSPFKTIQEAANVTTPGDVVNVKGGIAYADIGRAACTIDSGNNSAVLCIEIPGTSSNPIHYKAWPGYGIPVIDAQYVNRGISPKVGFVIIDGFHIKRPSSSLGLANNVGCIRNSGVISNKITIINNIFENCRETPLNIFSFGETNIINNTIIYTEEPNYAPWITLFSIAGGNIKGNVFQTNLYVLDISLSDTGINFSNNYFYAGNATYPDMPGNVVNTNPLFIDLANGNFRLQPNSPAINSGVDVSALGVTKDILGVPRPQGSGYDIGAYENYSIPVSITSPTGEYVTTTSATFSGSATTISNATITKVQYSLDDGAWTDATGNFSFTLNDLSQGSHTVKVRAIDSYGNQTHESQYATKAFTVDSIVPTLKIEKLGLIGGIPDKNKLTYYFTSQTPKIEAITEPNSTIEFTVDNSTRTATADIQGTLSIRFDSPKLSRGFNVINYKAIDLAGNSSETRTLSLIIGEEFFPDWLYNKTVVEGKVIEEIDQTDNPDSSNVKPAIPGIVYKIQFKDAKGNQIIDTRVQLAQKFYTTDDEGYIFIPDLKTGELTYSVNGVTGTAQFDQKKEINEIIVELPEAVAPDKEQKISYNWWLLLILPILLIGSLVGYKYYARKLIILAIFLLSPFVFAQLSPAYAAQYYVAGDTGIDTNPGSTSQPWRTIQKAADVMVAGDTVNVKGGIVYSEQVLCNTPWGNYKTVVCLKNNSGTAGSPITFQAWGGTGIPIINPSVANVGNGFVVYNRSYIRIEGFHIKEAHFVSSSPAGILVIRNANGITVSNNIFSDSQRAVFVDGDYADLSIINNTITDIYGSAILFYSEDGTTSVINNSISNSNIAINLDASYMSAYMSLNQNLFHNNTTNYVNISGSSTDINSDPLFIDPANGDFQLQTNSPAINAGANTTAYGVVTDILGRARPNAGAYDIGAYEDQNIYVAGDVATSGNGSIQSPFKTIQEAADIASPGDIVNVKGGLVYNTTTCSNGIVCPQNSGTALNKTTYTSWAGTGIATIDGNARSKPGFALFGKSFIEIKYFNLINTQSGVIAYGVDHLWIQNNIINNSLTGVNLGNGTTNIWVTNNTAVKGMFGFITGSTDSSELYIRNNIASNNDYFGFGANNGYTGMISENNIAYGNTVANFHFTYPQSASDTVINPLFVDLTNQNFRLQPNSPAINAGVDVSAFGVTRDILGVPRPQDSGYDLGAYENYSIPVSITSPTGEYVTTTSPVFSGSATTISTATITKVQYSLDDGAWTDATGNFSFTLNNLAQGSHTVKVRAIDSYGNQTHESEYATKTFIVDTVTPEIKIIKLGLIGNIPNKNSLTYYFTSQTPQVKGVSEANSTVTFATDSHSYSTEADGNGNFSITLNTPKLNRGRTDLSYLFVDKAGNSSETRKLTLIIGEEFFPDWLYSLVVDKGEEIENVGQSDKQDDFEKEVGQGNLPAVATAKILITDSENGPIPNTKVQIDNRYYTTDANGFIYVTKLESGRLKFQIKSVSGEFEFDSKKEINEIRVTLPAEAPIKESKSNFNWLWVLLVPVLIVIGYAGYRSFSKKE